MIWRVPSITIMRARVPLWSCFMTQNLKKLFHPRLFNHYIIIHFKGCNDAHVACSCSRNKLFRSVAAPPRSGISKFLSSHDFKFRTRTHRRRSIRSQENKKKTMFFKDSSRLKKWRQLKRLRKVTIIYNIKKRHDNFSNPTSPFFEWYTTHTKHAYAVIHTTLDTH